MSLSSEWTSVSLNTAYLSAVARLPSKWPVREKTDLSLVCVLGLCIPLTAVVT